MYDIISPHQDLIKPIDLSFFRMDSPERQRKNEDNIEMKEKDEKELRKLQLQKELELIEEKIQSKKNQMNQNVSN